MNPAVAAVPHAGLLGRRYGKSLRANRTAQKAQAQSLALAECSPAPPVRRPARPQVERRPARPRAATANPNWSDWPS